MMFLNGVFDYFCFIIILCHVCLLLESFKYFLLWCFESRLGLRPKEWTMPARIIEAKACACWIISQWCCFCLFQLISICSCLIQTFLNCFETWQSSFHNTLTVWGERSALGGVDDEFPDAHVGRVPSRFVATVPLRRAFHCFWPFTSHCFLFNLGNQNYFG